jgi:proteasome accessory factor C
VNDAARQLRRLLLLIPAIADGDARSIEEVAALAQTDRDTIFKDLYSLSERFGDPGGFIPGLEVIVSEREVRVRSAHFQRPMRLNVPELSALDLGLAMLRRERLPEEAAVIERARGRLREAMTTLSAAQMKADLLYAESGAAANPEHLRLLRTAVRQLRKSRIAYRRADAEQTVPRVVCPYGLVAASGAWYLVAYCEFRSGLRVFRLDRAERIELLEDRFAPPDGFSLDEVIAGNRVFQHGGGETLRVRYSQRIARWIAEREGVPLAADGSLTIEHALADEEWAVRHVLQYGPDAEILGPPALRAAVRRRLEQSLSG